LSGNETRWETETIRLGRAHDCFCLGAIAPMSQGIPIYIGATGPRMTELTGEIGDGLLLELNTQPEEVPVRLKQLASGVQRAHRHNSDVDVVALIVAAVSGPDGKIDPATLCWVAQFVSRLDEPQILRRGFDPERTQRVREAYRQGDYVTAGNLLSPEMVRAFGAIGTFGQCVDRLEEYVRMGVTLPVLIPMGGDLNALIRLGARYAHANV